MLRHNLLLIYRSFKKFKSTFIINLVGLSTGLACTLLIFLWVRDEMNVDKFHEKDSRLYQVKESQQLSGNIRVMNSTPGLLAEALTEEMPEVEFAATVTPAFWFEKSILSFEDKDIKASGQYAGKDFFNIFSFELLQGDKDQVLADKSSMVISEELALRLFNTTENILGKGVEFQHEKEFIVSGIFDNVTNSSDNSDFILSYEVFKDINKGVLEWGNSGPNTFLTLKEGTDPGNFENKIKDFIKSKHTSTHRTLLLTKFSDNYLYGNYENGVQGGGRIEYVRMFSLIAIFILVIACINFMNLSTAKASGKLKEIGIKKTIGASRTTLVFQYLGESMLMTLLSMLLALLLVLLLLPQFNLITGKALSLELDFNLMLALICIALITGLIAGSYPALYLSKFNPIAVLKGNQANSLGEVMARKGLVILQFTLSTILIVAVLIIYKQISYVQTKNIGYDKDNVIYFEREGKLVDHLETFLTEVENIPGIMNASSISQSLIGGGNTTYLDWEGKDPDEKVFFAIRPVNYGVIEMLDMEIKEGRSFSREFGRDSLKIIINEAAVKTIGLPSPVGRVVNRGETELEIVGVVKDFHFESLQQNVDPMFFILIPEYTSKIMAKIEAGKEKETIERLQALHESFNPGFVFDYRFLDQDYQAQYVAEQRVSVLSRYFAGLAILISCLGLFGLAAFTAERRIKEIGIRKVLGASEWKIMELLSGDFAKMVLVAIFIALPLSYYLTSNWLDGFAYKIDLRWWYFVGAGALTMLIALLTVSFQSIKAALMNPVKSLKSE
ncbi:FtsX-like permease family protein [Algoriphagus sp. D3-2-R+10]|uniref:ABC transporter permease n=1 Tax=Algoriphagus aurantiacus TaxID=3103948 RepID=UPI002B365B92|nr:ABC transporter permease [Algoriphagus sp. D3-2-R+10]MEB2776345.1 FtsX-like permease family protein [Algoriphagus sp. D3-2-R+10]